METLPFASGQPLTDKERAQDVQSRRDIDQRVAARHKATPRNGYKRPMTKGHVNAYKRMTADRD